MVAFCVGEGDSSTNVPPIDLFSCLWLFRRRFDAVVDGGRTARLLLGGWWSCVRAVLASRGFLFLFSMVATVVGTNGRDAVFRGVFGYHCFLFDGPRLAGGFGV
jgi:hypothetical protein